MKCRKHDVLCNICLDDGFYPFSCTTPAETDHMAGSPREPTRHSMCTSDARRPLDSTTSHRDTFHILITIIFLLVAFGAPRSQATASAMKPIREVHPQPQEAAMYYDDKVACRPGVCRCVADSVRCENGNLILSRRWRATILPHLATSLDRKPRCFQHRIPAKKNTNVN